MRYVNTAIEDFANESLDGSRLKAVIVSQVRKDFKKEGEDSGYSLVEGGSLLALRKEPLTIH